LKRSERPADERHPFGYSKAIYFWSFVVAILLFSLGAGVALYEGYDKLLHPHPIHDPIVLYVVLAMSIALESISTWKALAAFNAGRNGGGFVDALKNSKDPSVFAIVLEDLAALAGLAIAFVGVAAAHLGGYEQADGIASMLIGVLLGLVAVFMAREIASLIVGESASSEMQDAIRALIEGETGPAKSIRAIKDLKTLHLGPQDVLVAASVDFQDQETAHAVEAVTAKLSATIKARFPEVRHFFIEVQSGEAGAIAAPAHATTTA
jgi:cation diffusion facilitator family transporter